MKFINAATIALELDFSPTVTEFGSMVDILGVGVLIRGSSGVGKSECVLGLIERGYSLVSDDVTRIKSLEGRELMATSPDLTRYHMEVRGIGIINVVSIFGIGAIRIEKRLDLVVTLKDWQELEEVDRIGLDQEFYEILKCRCRTSRFRCGRGADIAPRPHWNRDMRHLQFENFVKFLIKPDSSTSSSSCQSFNVTTEVKTLLDSNRADAKR